MLEGIFTDRYFQQWPSWHLVYEWEDILAQQLSLKLIDSRSAAVTTPFADRALISIARRLKLHDRTLLKYADKFASGPLNFCFEMFPQNAFNYHGSRHTIPCIIDFWKNQDLTSFYKAYNNCKAVLISSKEVFDWLKDNDCRLNIYHFPLSLSDIYMQDTSGFPEKRYDVILAGRTSPVFIEYLKVYESLHPALEYLQAEHIDGQLYFRSNKTGLLGNFHKRNDYMNLLSQCRSAFYSTPGIDGNEARTGGFNPVTPRLFELAASGCNIIARYPENADTKFFNLEEYYPSVSSYEQFETQLCKALNTDPGKTLNRNRNFLKDNYTSGRAALLKDILTRLN